jgi:ABC-type multidrug transport system fused ATPase/permease subunit
MSDAVNRAVAGPPPGAPRPDQALTPAVPGPAQPGSPNPGQPLPPQEARSAVLLQGVSKTYASGKEALISVDLVIPEGDFIFLVGPSGAGKSTLIKLLVRDE